MQGNIPDQTLAAFLYAVASVIEQNEGFERQRLGRSNDHSWNP